MKSQKEKAEQLLNLHHGPQILVLPNAWDVGSAKIFENSGFPAIATTSAGVSWSLGRPDGQNLTTAEAARWLSIDAKTLRRLAAANSDWMHPIGIGKATRWNWLDVVVLGHLMARRRQNPLPAGK